MQRTLTRAGTLLGLSMLLAATASAQGRGRRSNSYPPGFKPPPGMCRVWLQGVPPGRQPGVTDCVSARAMASANSTVLYGDRSDNPSYHGRAGTYLRSVYDAYGNRVTQRVRRNDDGSLSVLSSTPYGVNGRENGRENDGENGGVRGKTLPGMGNTDVYTNGRGHSERHYGKDEEDNGRNRKEHEDRGRNRKDHEHSGDNDHR